MVSNSHYSLVTIWDVLFKLQNSGSNKLNRIIRFMFDGSMSTTLESPKHDGIVKEMFDYIS